MTDVSGPNCEVVVCIMRQDFSLCTFCAIMETNQKYGGRMVMVLMNHRVALDGLPGQ